MSQPAHHVLDVYGAHIHLATDRRAWATLRRRYSGMVDTVPESAGWCRIATFHPKGGGITELHLVLWVDVAAHHAQPGELLDTCAHEATHAALALMDHIGHDPRGSADEPIAYLVGWLTRWMWERIPMP